MSPSLHTFTLALLRIFFRFPVLGLSSHYVGVYIMRRSKRVDAWTPIVTVRSREGHQRSMTRRKQVAMDVLHSRTRYVSAYIIKRIYDTESRNHSCEALSILEQLETRYSPGQHYIARLPITPSNTSTEALQFVHEFCPYSVFSPDLLSLHHFRLCGPALCAFSS